MELAGVSLKRQHIMVSALLHLHHSQSEAANTNKNLRKHVDNPTQKNLYKNAKTYQDNCSPQFSPTRQSKYKRKCLRINLGYKLNIEHIFKTL